MMRRLRYGNLADLHEISRQAGVAKDPLAPEYRQNFINALHIQQAEELFTTLGFKASAESLSKLVNCLTNPQVSADAIRRFALELDGRITDELHRTTLLTLSLEDERRYNDTTPFGHEVADWFSSAAYDVEEATKCLALERSTACVFHLMRVIEVGVRVAGKSLNDPSIDVAQNPTWQNLIDKFQRELNKKPADQSAAWRSNAEFFAGVTAHLFALKVAWRNPTMHIERTYNQAEAEDVGRTFVHS